MVKANVENITDRLITGEKIENPAYQNPEIAKAIANKWIYDDLEKLGVYDNFKKKIIHYYGKRDLAKQVLKLIPFYYDNGKNWWRWEFGLSCWVLTDEVDIINWINHLAEEVNTINSKERNEIIESLRQEARLNKPKDIKPTWIQFKKEIFDIKTGEQFEATPEYFVTNPISYELNKDLIEDTPTMDKIFEEWVGKEYIKTLYEIIAYCLLPSYPIHRLFCLLGAGMNGKSCFINLLKKFIGVNNCTSTELDILLNSRFEVTRLHKKLICIMGETNFNELSQTSILKKLTGGDLIGFEYKNKTPFEDNNYAKILIATNNLPETTDKTLGFYRRWCIIDFPNQFSEQKDILDDIPEEEYESLALKSCSLLHDLLKNRKFYNEGDVEERMKKYEEKSNPFDKFINDRCDLTDPNGDIWKFEFEKEFKAWCKNNRFREHSQKIIAKEMQERSIGTAQKTTPFLINGENKVLRIWVGIKWK